MPDFIQKHKVSVFIDNLFGMGQAIVVAWEILNYSNPSIFEWFGKAITTFMRNVTVGNCTEIRVETNTGKMRFCSNLEVILYRITCELIHNMLKHASASKAFIVANAHCVRFHYGDDGVGF